MSVTAKAVHLPCPKCAEPLANIALYLGSIGDPDDSEFKCVSCDEEFTREDVEQWIAGAEAWRKVLAWIDTMLVIGEE